LAVSGFNPIISNNRSRRTVFQRVADCSDARRAETIVLKCNPDCRRVVIVLKRAADNAVAKNIKKIERRRLRK